MDFYQGFIHFLSNACTCGKHYAPLVHSCQARAFFSCDGLWNWNMCSGHVSTYPRPAMVCPAECCGVSGKLPASELPQAGYRDSTHGSSILILALCHSLPLLLALAQVAKFHRFL